VKMNDEHDLEKDFERLVPLPTPPGLRERVLGAALEARRDTALTPRMRLSAVVCAVLIVVVLGFGPLLGRRESAQMAALLDGRPPAGMEGMEAGALAEMAGLESADAKRMVKLLALASSAEREKRRSRLDEALRWPKGWSAYEISEDLD
jgi:hypothetical protein